MPRNRAKNWRLEAKKRQRKKKEVISKKGEVIWQKIVFESKTIVEISSEQ